MEAIYCMATTQKARLAGMFLTKRHISCEDFYEREIGVSPSTDT